MTRPLTKEEAEALEKDLTAVLEKHNCDMGVVASIQIMKRSEEGIPSPFIENNAENPDKTKESSDPKTT